MGHVVVTIAGRSFRLACDDGDEDRLAALAKTFDTTVDHLRQTFGEVGDTRLAVMAGLMMTDQLGDAQAQIKRLQEQVAQLQAALDLAQSSNAGANDQLRQRIEGLAERIEQLAHAPQGG